MPSLEASFRIVRDLTLDVLYFPLWWYSSGLIDRLQKTGEWITDSATSLQIGVWIKNIFVPMYGQYDWQSRIISVFMRVVQIIGRLFGLLFWTLFALLLLGLYVFGPIVLLLLIVYHTLFNGQALYYGA